MSITTLEEKGTPWAECYRGSGRLTGRLTAEPVYMNTGEPAPNWTWLGGFTQEDFDDRFLLEEHWACHDPEHSNPNCPLCQKEAGQ